MKLPTNDCEIGRPLVEKRRRWETQRRSTRRILKVNAKDDCPSSCIHHIDHERVRLSEFPSIGGVRQMVHIRGDCARREGVPLLPQIERGCVSRADCHEAEGSIAGIEPSPCLLRRRKIRGVDRHHPTPVRAQSRIAHEHVANAGPSIHGRGYCATRCDVGDVHQMVVVSVTDKYYRGAVGGLRKEALDRGSARRDRPATPEKKSSWNDSRKAGIGEEGRGEQDMTFVTYDQAGNAEVHDLDLLRRVATGFWVATDWLESGRRVDRDRPWTA